LAKAKTDLRQFDVVGAIHVTLAPPQPYRCAGQRRSKPLRIVKAGDDEAPILNFMRSTSRRLSKWMDAAMTKPILDKAEVAIEYPDKFYLGTFERTARFDAHLDATGIALVFERTGMADDRKTVHMHINYGLFADILRDLANTVAAMPATDVLHREALADAAQFLHEALAKKST
jgi:hypothetical protein